MTKNCLSRNWLAPARAAALLTLLSAAAMSAYGQTACPQSFTVASGGQVQLAQFGAFSLSPDDLRLSLEKLDQCVDKYRGSNAECLVFYKGGNAVNDLASIRVSSHEGRNSMNYKALACAVKQGGK